MDGAVGRRLYSSLFVYFVKRGCFDTFDEKCLFVSRGESRTSKSKTERSGVLHAGQHTSYLIYFLAVFLQARRAWRPASNNRPELIIIYYYLFYRGPATRLQFIIYYLVFRGPAHPPGGCAYRGVLFAIGFLAAACRRLLDHTVSGRPVASLFVSFSFFGKKSNLAKE